MLNEFKPGELPGGDIRGAPEDINSYERIEEVAKLTIETCLIKLRLYGWMQTGMTCSRPFSTSWLSLENYPRFAAFELLYPIPLLRCIEGRQRSLILVLTNSIRR